MRRVNMKIRALADFFFLAIRTAIYNLQYRGEKGLSNDPPPYRKYRTERTVNVKTEDTTTTTTTTATATSHES